jgi:DNA-binding CsgD family transcriptional regulator
MRKSTNLLNDRDLLLIEFLKLGLSRVQIAKRLKVTTNTANSYLSNLRLKTNSLTDKNLLYKFDNKEIYKGENNGTV